jgi:transketolase
MANLEESSMTNSAAARAFEPALSAEQLTHMSNAIRALSMDAVQKANSGHPGMPMGMADVATVLYTKFLKFDPSKPDWADRDRFVLSAGHGSMLLYALNYLTGYEKITLEEIRNFRQLHSKTPGHPEVDVPCGIETTTGPLGQGISTAVGMALAERIQNAKFGDEIVSHYTYVIASDGDLMEGVSHEACALAGHLKLGKLIVLYDDNGITIDGSTELSFTENVPGRFEAYGWDVQKVDGHDMAQIEAAIAKAQKTDTPSIICCKTVIGFGSPNKAGKSSSHGAPLGEDEVKASREVLKWVNMPFDMPKEILEQWRAIGRLGQADRKAWEQRLQNSGKGGEFEKLLDKDVSKDAAQIVLSLKKAFLHDKPKMATRQTSGECLEKLVPGLPQMIGGSADLTGSNNTKVKASKFITKADYNGNYINYGVREHGMAAIMNGMALHGGIIPYAGTFLQFADYARPAIRLAALMKQRVVHVMTHDSIGLGEDGPTHQPVEHLAALRAIPNCYVFRPCDGVETAECWELALNKKDAPSVLSLTRQGLPTLRQDSEKELETNKCARGAYILKDCNGNPKVTIFASGSEVEIAISAAEKLGDGVRVVSVPCMELFFEQPREYVDTLIFNQSVKVGIEAAVRFGWDSIIGRDGIFIGMKGFGESAPAGTLYKHFGITAEAVVEAVRQKM